MFFFNSDTTSAILTPFFFSGHVTQNFGDVADADESCRRFDSTDSEYLSRLITASARFGAVKNAGQVSIIGVWGNAVDNNFFNTLKISMAILSIPEHQLRTVTKDTEDIT